MPVHVAAPGLTLSWWHACVQSPVWLNGEYIKALAASASAKPSSEPLGTTIANFYMTDAISRASQTMAKCVQSRAAAQVAGKI